LGCSRKSQRLPGNSDLRLLDVGNNFFQRLFRARIESCKSQSCACQSQEVAAT
jgi:hypothetical protein